MKMQNQKSFFELLCENNPDEMLDYLISKGKGPKPICPIEFVKEIQKDDNENCKD